MRTALVNAKIYLERDRFAEALLIEGERILAVGTTAEIIAAANDDELTLIDCAGRTVVPGFNDSHIHLCSVGRALAQAPLGGARSIDDLIERCRSFRAENPTLCENGLYAQGWNQDFFTEGERRMPDRHDLDRIATDIPVVLSRVCGHILACNTRAIELLGLGIGSPQYPDGLFETEADGYPNGRFAEHACTPVQALIPPLSRAANEELFLRACRYAVEHGVTSVQTNDVNISGPGPQEVFDLIADVYASGRGILRYHHQMCLGSTEALRDFLGGERLRTDRYQDDWLTLGPLKLLKDGSLGARTATMRHDYLDEPGNTGVEAITNELMDELCAIANNAGLPVAIHAIGDAAIEDVLNSFEKVQPQGANPLRNSIVHCQITDRALLERIAAMDVLVQYQPIFLATDMHAVLPRCGEALSSTSYAFNTLHALGAHASYGTDSPVEDLNPLWGLYCAVTRQDLSGHPEGGFFPAECVDISTAVDAYTYESAYCQHMEDRKGRIAEGFLADLVVLDADIFTIPAEEIKNVLPTLTMVGGRVVYEKPCC